MYCQKVLLFVLALVNSLLINSNYLRRADRIKRIIHGSDLSSYDSGYNVVRYFTWLGNAHSCGYWESFKYQLHPSSTDYYLNCNTDSADLRCGGALVTPKIIQTACHCIAKLSEIHKPRSVLSRYIAEDANIDLLVAFVGSTSTADMKTGYLTKKYIIHERCSKIVYNTYDYGIIVLRKNVDDKNAAFASNPDNFSPIYSQEGLSYMWNKLINNEAACLFVGYGYYLEDEATPESIMQHYWGVIRNYQRCYEWTATTFHEGDDDTWDGSTKLNYSNYATWYCSTMLAGKLGQTGSGDSGSPVTCDNQLVGLISTGFDYFRFNAFDYDFNTRLTNALTTVFPIYFASWENTIEHRENFVGKTLKLT